MLFLIVPEDKVVKNRLHLDLSPPAHDGSGGRRGWSTPAPRVDGRVDEGGSFWTVMADPEGNEFCVLRGPDDDPPRQRPV